MRFNIIRYNYILENRLYIKKALGEPMVSVELDDSQIDLCFEDAQEMYELFNIKKRTFGIKRQWIRRYALALAMEYLALIRGKYQSISLPNGDLNLNSQQLIDLSIYERSNLENQIGR